MTSAHDQPGDRAASSPSMTASMGPPTEGGGLSAIVQSPSRRMVGGRWTGSYASRSSRVMSPPCSCHLVHEDSTHRTRT